MKNDSIKLAAILALMWFMPHCAQKQPSIKEVKPQHAALSVQEDCLLISIERRLCKLEATTCQPIEETTTRGQPVPIRASEAANQ